MRKYYRCCNALGKIAGLFTFIGILSLLTSFSCASPGRKELENQAGILTENKLYQIVEEVRFTKFYYPDKVESGLMLRWMPDSIFIQERGEDKPIVIPTHGLTMIETITGNRIMPGIALGAVIAGGYFAAIKGYELGTVTFGEAVAKLLIPPSILITSIGIGSSMETREVYRLPPDFNFNYEAAQRRLQDQ